MLSDMGWLFFPLFGTLLEPLSRLSARGGLIPSREDFPELAEAFATGEFEWNDFILYGLYLIKFLLLFAGVTAIIGIMLGGYRYIFGSLVEDKEKGRDTLKHVGIGFALVVLSWAIVDIVITLLTVG